MDTYQSFEISASSLDNAISIVHDRLEKQTTSIVPYRIQIKSVEMLINSESPFLYRIDVWRSE